ncbi:MAG: quinolinate synthase NadA [Oligoflexales bacterium]
MTLSVSQTFTYMRTKLEHIVPPAELMLQAELVVEIEELKQEKNAVILGHNYMEPTLYHTVPDFVGDSLELARKSAETSADIIVFCGVEFMAETAKILNPGKKVLIPSDRAGCSLAESISASDVRALKEKHPGVPVVTYVNSYAEVKAETDICCTSGNAKAVVNALDSDKVIFIPDEYLARNIARETGKLLIVPKKNNLGELDTEQIYSPNSLISWNGKCEVHEQFSLDDIKMIRSQFPEAVILAHPECSPDVCEASDFSGSTSKMIDYVAKGSAKQFALMTECSMGDNIAAENQDKELLRLCSIRCPHMAQISLEMTRNALRDLKYEITLPDEILLKAKKSLDRMLEIA